MKKLITSIIIISSLSFGLVGCVDAPQRRIHSVPVTQTLITTTTTTDVSGNKTVVVERQVAPQQVIVVREPAPYYGPYYYPTWNIGIGWVHGGGHHHHHHHGPYRR